MSDVEKRLAEAAALLESCVIWFDGGAVASRATITERLHVFLSAAPRCVPSEKPPTQAAEPECHDVLCLDTHNAQCPVYEHPDTTALRECRAELERVRSLARRFHESLTAEYAKAEGD